MIQVLVYAGAIMVLFMFVVMSVPYPDREEIGLLRGFSYKALAVVATAVLVWKLLLAVDRTPIRVATSLPDDFGDVYGIGRLLFSDYLFPFEAISILLLVAIVGAVMVSRRVSAGLHPSRRKVRMISQHVLFGLGAILFGVGLLGVIIRRNLLVVLMSIELMLNAVNVTFVGFAHHQSDITGHGMAFFVIALAAAEAAVGLAIVVAVFRSRGNVYEDSMRLMKR